MIHIVLVCAAGMSTSLLVNKMKKAAEKREVEIQIQAMPTTQFDTYKGQTDVLLLGPQVSYLYDKMKAENEPKGIKVSVINMMEYGTMDGEKVLDSAIRLYEGG